MSKSKKTNSGKGAAASAPRGGAYLPKDSDVPSYGRPLAGASPKQDIPGNFGVRGKGAWPTYPKSTGKTTSDGVEFNLPPHLWSLPINPINRSNVTSKYLDNSDSDDIRNNIGTKIEANHSIRRGKMWLFSDINDTVPVAGSSDKTEPNTENEGGKSLQGGAAQDRKELLQKLANLDKSGVYKQIAADYKPYGFQFLWNPESIQVSVSVNTQIVPDAGDRFRSVVGVFPSTETVSFSLILDRTNDFACVYRDFYQNNSNITSVSDKYKTYYQSGLNQKLAGSTSFSDKLQNLMEFGTMHDLEYVFKMLNAGTIYQNIQPTNPLGRKTFDLGYLYPALVAIEFGPSTTVLKPISYVAWLQSVAFKHTAFNTNMVPLRTEVSFEAWVYTGFGKVDSR